MQIWYNLEAIKNSKHMVRTLQTHGLNIAKTQRKYIKRSKRMT